MKIDILFWFYTEFKACAKKLKKIRSCNKDARVFALYGGPLSETHMARQVVNPYVDDFYVYRHEKEPRWKWENGEQILADWYLERGQHLPWETIFIMQWDMLISAPLQELFSGLQPGEILLSGFRPMHEVASWWHWANPKNPNLKAFKALLRKKFHYEDELAVCLFIVACFPRIFFEKFVGAGHPEVGFIEYKIPTMANMFRIPVCHKHGFHPWWGSDPTTKNAPPHQRLLNATGQEVPLSVILKEFSKNNGQRLFHPVFRHYPKWMENRYIAVILYYLHRSIRRIYRIGSLVKEKV